MDHTDNDTMSRAVVLANRRAVLVIPENSVYRHLVERAQELGIDISNASLQSRIFHDLLQNIRTLEQLREYFTGLANGDMEPLEPADTSLPSDFIHLRQNAQSQPTFDPVFDLSNYDESPQSSFYSRLLDTRLKLRHEIEALRYLKEGNQDESKSLSTGYSQASDDDESPPLRIRVRSREPEEKIGLPRKPDAVFYDRKHRAQEASENSSEAESLYNGDSNEPQDNAKAVKRYLSYGNDELPDWLLVHLSTGSSGDRGTLREVPQLTEVFYAKRNLSTNGHSPRDGILKIKSILAKYPAIAFVVERRYNYDFPCPDWTTYKEEDCVQQTITFLSEPLKRVLEPFKPTSRSPVRWDLILFHCRSEITATMTTQPAHLRLQMQLLLDATLDDFEKATNLFNLGMVTPLHLDKLFSWRTVIVVPGEPVETYRCGVQSLRFNPSRSAIHIEASRWFFNGKLHLTTSPMTIYASHGPMQICKLSAYPLHYAKAEVKDFVANRGRKFWMCRRKAFISYGAPGQVQRSQGPANYRFMIDYDTYRELHPDAEEFSYEDFEPSTEIDEADMNKDIPPGNGLELVFPPHISGYSIQDKKWKTLSVDYIKPITWNKLAFERLVLKPVAKELIQAVVQVHESQERSADLMQGKGNGSLILLHGPPGTGKTLTAESVAELVQRPLYRVSCGDVGTDPENVESYLESVLYIGKIWGCVVLLDEADVFLEERTLTDLHRNALVSVFLRVLEYYDGVLILTSNRVGTFDEAFKSRIKLALHYSSLGRADRRKIWRNFFKTLKETDPDHVDFEDLDDHLDDLADVKLNGRDIRNAISVARELAQFRKDEKVDYHHIRHVIGVGEEFESYLDKTHGHKTDDWLKENGIRA